MSSITRGWSTSFIYKQDLTSYYMNSVVRSIIRPGIYNANMCCFKGTPTVGNTLTAEGLCLYIKKGTTFIFSNDYTSSSTYGIRRNFNQNELSYAVRDNSNSENSCVIKCVALNDMSVALGDFPETGTFSIHAFFNYDPEDSGSLTVTSPTFFLVKESGSDAQLYTNQGDLRYSSELGGSNINMGEFPILDGKKLSNDSSENTSLYNKLEKSFYLNVGFIKFKNSTIKSFTGRGLPEYRHFSTLDSNVMMPDIIPNMVNNGDEDVLYFDIPESIVGTLIIEEPLIKEGGNKDLNWEAAYLGSRMSTSDNMSSISIDGNDGTYAVYATVSNIKSFDTTSSVSNSIVKFNKCEIPGLELQSVVFEDGDSSPLTQCTPLDVCNFNIRSLLSSIRNIDIWSYVIDIARQDATNSELENGEPILTDVIPIALVTITDGAIDHSKTLCYFGLQDRLGKINVIDIKEHNILNVVPVMA